MKKNLETQEKNLLNFERRMADTLDFVREYTTQYYRQASYENERNSS